MNRLVIVTATLASLTACAVGPDYTPQKYSAYDSARETARCANDSAECRSSETLKTWWSTFSDPTLDSLIATALNDNLNLKQARARVLQARAVRTQSRAGFWPALGVGLDGRRSKSSIQNTDIVADEALFERASGEPTNRFQAAADLAWEIDLFGSIRRQSEAASAAVDASFHNQYATQVSLLGEVGTTYLQLLGAREELAVIKRNLAYQEETLVVTREKFESGFAGALEVAANEGLVATTRSRIAPLEAQVETTRHALAVLLGKLPAAFTEDSLALNSKSYTIPPSIPVDLSSEILRRRPDVLSAEATLQEATANIGVATAELFPKFSISGALGVASVEFSSLSKGDRSEFWNIGGILSLPVFNAGRLIAGVDFAEAKQQEAFAAFELAILTALKEVQSAEVNYRKESEHFAALHDAYDATQRSLTLSKQMYHEGLSDYLSVLDAQRSALAAENDLTQSKTQLAVNAVTLYKALGGGW